MCALRGSLGRRAASRRPCCMAWSGAGFGGAWRLAGLLCGGSMSCRPSGQPVILTTSYLATLLRDSRIACCLAVRMSCLLVVLMAGRLATLLRDSRIARCLVVRMSCLLVVLMAGRPTTLLRDSRIACYLAVRISHSLVALMAGRLAIPSARLPSCCHSERGAESRRPALSFSSILAVLPASYLATVLLDSVTSSCPAARSPAVAAPAAWPGGAGRNRTLRA